jgi:hypothetical protein
LANSLPSAIFYFKGSWPIPCHRQYFILREVGQFLAIGNILFQRKLANSFPSAIFYFKGSWPIPCHRQHFISTEVGQFLSIGNILF